MESIGDKRLLETATSRGESCFSSQARTQSDAVSRASRYSLRSQKTNTARSTQRTANSRRSELDMSSMSEQNREKLLETFLPDIRRIHARMGYTQPVRPFNLNQENLKTVQLRAKTRGSVTRRAMLREHSEFALGSGVKAANSTLPQPAWDVKELQINGMNDRLFPGQAQALTAYVKKQDWSYKDLRNLLDRPLPKKTRDK